MARQACGVQERARPEGVPLAPVQLGAVADGVVVVADHSDLVVHEFPRLPWGEIVVPGVLNAARDLAAASRIQRRYAWACLEPAPKPSWGQMS